MVWHHWPEGFIPEEVRFHSERQEALRQETRRQVQCSELKGYRENKGLGVRKGEVVLERGILGKSKS